MPTRVQLSVVVSNKLDLPGEIPPIMQRSSISGIIFGISTKLQSYRVPTGVDSSTDAATACVQAGVYYCWRSFSMILKSWPWMRLSKNHTFPMISDVPMLVLPLLSSSIGEYREPFLSDEATKPSSPKVRWVRFVLETERQHLQIQPSVGVIN